MKHEKVERYLSSIVEGPVRLLNLTPLGDSDAETKGYGYGVPVRIDYLVADQDRRTAVLHTMSPGPFGHEHMADRAQVLLWAHDAFNRLPRHVRSLDIGAFQTDGNIVSLRDTEEFCLLTEYAKGCGYFRDLERISETGSVTDLDLARADALCDYLAVIHRNPVHDSGLYMRRIRELVGHGECIMGLVDSYPASSWITAQRLENIEHQCVSWRWRLKSRSHRLRRIHGDFHPWNILFESDCDFHLLDRSRGEYGDPADDIACLTLNYVFFSLQRKGRLEGGFETLFQRFWHRYLQTTGDTELLEVVAPYCVFRALVMASPLWYPSLPETVRRMLMRFIDAVLGVPAFDPAAVNAYCGA